MTAVIGISAFYHDSAACLIIDGEIIAAAQEERFTRKKHDSDFPKNSIEYILSEGNLSLTDIDSVVFYDKPFLKFERLLETYIAFVPKGLKSFFTSMPIVLREKLFLKDLLIKKIKFFDKNFSANKLFFSEHHLSHAASAFYPSEFDEAIVLTMDGVGEWATASVAIGKKNKIEIKKEMHYPHSLGLLYSAFTYYLGFKVNSGEYKVMGLAPYGIPKYKDIILNDLMDLKEDGTFNLDQSYFNYSVGLTMTNKKFSNLFGQSVRKKESELEPFHMDIAASIQAATEEIMLMMTRSLHEEYKIDNLCLAGGVALNCVANGKILKDKKFKNLWVQPAAGDAGGAVGAALMFWFNHMEKDRFINGKDSMKGSYLGPSYNAASIKEELLKNDAKFEIFSNEEVTDYAAESLSEGKIVGWFQGRMEFGPRALGNRSILADPTSKSMQKNLNLKVKYRESFRPFAPSILREDLENWFELSNDSPYMQFVCSINKDKRITMTEEQEKLFGIEKLNINRSSIPAVTHVDYSARIQTVHSQTNKRYHTLISKFKEKTNCPILVNTSFNVRGEPIVNSPTDAYKCFMGTGIDILIIENYVIKKDSQKKENIIDYKNYYEPD
jgi:carbamoyltransferase|tara:strand:- start:318 stop:2150 length:1833 start_codon:yes stop_codon:yes gene_type:complete